LGRVESASETQPFFFGHNEQSLKFAALGGQERRLGGILAEGDGIPMCAIRS
jgi:hypothetical protein